jgi:hypothetical protein
MRRLLGVLVLVPAVACSAGTANAQVGVGVGFDSDGLSHFQLAIGDHYGMPVGHVPAYLDPEELPIVYLLAREARVHPEVVMALRERGWTWLDITYHLGVDPYLYVHRLPYDYGYWGRPARRDFRYLTDRHIVDYVNLFFWADYYRRPVTQVIVIRHRTPTWVYVARHAPTIVVVNTPRYYNPPPVWRGARWAQPRTSSWTQPAGRITDGPVGRAAADVTRPATPTRTAVPATGAQRTTAPAATERGTAAPSRPAAAPVTRPAAQPTPTRPAAQPATRPATQTQPAARPAAQPASRPAAQPSSRPAAQPSSRPAAQPSSRPAAQPSSRPAAQPSSRPAAQPASRPAAQPSSRPAAQPSSRPAAQGSSRATPSSRPASRPGG